MPPKTFMPPCDPRRFEAWRPHQFINDDGSTIGYRTIDLFDLSAHENARKLTTETILKMLNQKAA